MSSNGGNIEDEREQADTQAALAAAERRYRDLFEKLPLPLAVYDVETLRFLAVNDAAVTSYAYSRDELLTMTVADLLPAEDVPALLDEIASTVSRGVRYRPSGRWRLVRKDGTLIYEDVSTHDVDFEGRPARLLLAIDATERRQYEAQLAEATRMEAMGHLAGGIAHDFNNLLTAVNGYSDILIGELEGDARVESARAIRRAGAAAAELTKQILAFARRQAYAPRPVDLNAVVGSISQMLHLLIGERVRLSIGIEESPCVVLADPGQLEQVLMNLALNSRDAMPEGGVLAIEVRRVEDASIFHRDIAGRAVMLTVSDTGTGMDAATLLRAFEPFFTTKEAGHGTGLGLATIYGIVGQSNGRIWVESAVGRGTKVSVLFPRVEATPEPPEVKPLPQPAERGEGATILVVEHDPAVRAIVVATLEHAGYLVLVAGSSAQATALSDGLAETIDLLLTDVVMPGGKGLELADRLVAIRPSLRVVIMSGFDAAPDVAGRDNRFGFVAKPFGPNDLVAAVRKALSAP